MTGMGQFAQLLIVVGSGKVFARGWPGTMILWI
jgi:hypothetical protein